MEVLEEGNLMDRVPILLQRDLQYYQQHQIILQEKICPGVVGGKLDFPRYASFASIKIVVWWEDEYYAAHRKYSGLLNNISNDDNKKSENGGAEIVKNSDPEKFVSLVTKSADLLLNHIHSLSQESLDHADLTVLTATIGAAALIKNCLWSYIQCSSTSICAPKIEDEEGGSLKISYKQYSEITEALAERLLDLHCRLLCLYIIQDAETLDWESTQQFFESERGSYTVQMWWLYIKGTREDLWNSVPPTMAQRVFGGMLNETLTVLTIRYTQTVTTAARSQLLLTDMCNILFCVYELLPSICENGDAFIGLDLNTQSKVIRDIHTKCQELFSGLVLRGASLDLLLKLLKKNRKSTEFHLARLPCPWISFTLPCFSCTGNNNISSSSHSIGFELKVLLNAPQPNWVHLLQIILMHDATICKIILAHLLGNVNSVENFDQDFFKTFLTDESNIKCNNFLCSGECFNNNSEELKNDEIEKKNYEIILSLTFVIITTGKSKDISTLLAALEENSNWADCLDKQQLWNVKRPPWLEAILHLVYPISNCITQMLLNAVKTGASMYQAMSLAITCLSEMWDCIPEGLFKVSSLLAEAIPVSITCMSDSVLIQILFSSLYSKLFQLAAAEQLKGTDTAASNSEIYHCLCEAICSVDKDNKHTEQICLFLRQVKESKYEFSILSSNYLNELPPLSAVSTVKIDDLEDGFPQMSSTNSDSKNFNIKQADYIPEILVSDIITSNIGKKCLRTCYGFLKNHKDWLLKELGILDKISLDAPNSTILNFNEDDEQISVLRTMFFIKNKPFDQLLTGTLKLNQSFLQTKLNLSSERIWLHISKRHEFQSNVNNTNYAASVAAITNFFKN